MRPVFNHFFLQLFIWRSGVNFWRASLTLSSRAEEHSSSVEETCSVLLLVSLYRELTNRKKGKREKKGGGKKIPFWGRESVTPGNISWWRPDEPRLCVCVCVPDTAILVRTTFIFGKTLLLWRHFVVPHLMRGCFKFGHLFWRLVQSEGQITVNLRIRVRHSVYL